MKLYLQFANHEPAMSSTYYMPRRPSQYVQSIFSKSPWMLNQLLIPVPWLGLSLVFSNFSLSLEIFQLTVDVGVAFITVDYKHICWNTLVYDVFFIQNDINNIGWQYFSKVLCNLVHKVTWTMLEVHVTSYHLSFPQPNMKSPYRTSVVVKLYTSE